MRLRQLLLVYPSRPIREMLKKNILADLDDVQIVECGTGLDALCQLSTKAFDLVICSCCLDDLPILKIRRHVSEATPLNKDTQFIALLEPDVAEASLVEASFAHVVNMPFDSEALTRTINQACDPRKWRISGRFHIPGSKVVILVEDVGIEAELVNLSRGGVLTEVACDRSDLLLQSNPKLAIKLTMPNLDGNLAALPVKLTRFYAFDWDKYFRPIRMRMAFAFTDTAPEVAVELDRVLQRAEADGLFAEDHQVEPTRPG